jgi:F-type H+-transporting ATPase subunit delta
MAELATVARPYAEATFKAALEKNTLGATADSLRLLAAIARDEQMRFVLGNPKVSPREKKELFAAIGGGRLDDISRNLLSVLIDNHRDELIGEIAVQLDELKREYERVLKARITSAQPLDDGQRNDIVAALERRYGKKVEVELDVDPELLGGARVQVGDQVIHASVRDALAQMAAALTR